MPDIVQQGGHHQRLAGAFASREISSLQSMFPLRNGFAEILAIAAPFEPLEDLIDGIHSGSVYRPEAFFPPRRHEGRTAKNTKNPLCTWLFFPRDFVVKQ